MTLYVEPNEYIGTLGETVGVRVAIHKQDRHPFPEVDGFVVPPGNKIGIRVTLVSVKYGCIMSSCWRVSNKRI